MTVLSSDQRKVLEGVVVEARRVAEAACADRIGALGVTSDNAPAGLSDDDRRLRRGLRARQRQLGSTQVLVTEAGFEHWHRMLFARLLADNGLLVDDDLQQSVSMAEVAEYAAELGEADVWEVAARFASAMLPGIFRQDDPILSMRLPVNIRRDLERLLDQLPVEITTAEDSLGWVYQYWQKQRKKEINDSEVKIGGADLAPVTQLFTEDYMVRFLLENSLGAWWAARNPDSPLIEDWEFLRRNEDGTPAAGSFEQWPERVAEVTVMDPCCGSGHFLVAAFGMLWRMRAEEEGLNPATAQDAVLRDNIFGLELDPRCTQIAMFALAVEAWKQGGLRQLPIPNVACSGIPARAPVEEWTQLAKGDPQLEAGLARLHTLFRDADTLGSLIDPVRAAEDDSLESVEWQDIAPLLQLALTRETKHDVDPVTAVFGEAAAGIACASDYLSRRYALVATNVPYLGRGKQAPLLQGVSSAAFPESSGDLATSMVERCVRLASPNAGLALVTPENWLFLKTYGRLRVRLLSELSWRLVVRLGAGAFSAISGEVVKAALLVLERGAIPESLSVLALPDGSSVRREEQLVAKAFVSTMQHAQALNPDGKIVFEMLADEESMSHTASAFQGLKTGDNDSYVRAFWEVPTHDNHWLKMISSPDGSEIYSGRSAVVFCEDPEKPEAAGWSRVQGLGAWKRTGVAISTVGSLRPTVYDGGPFDSSPVVLIPRNPEDVSALYVFASSGQLESRVRQLDRKVAVTTATFSQIPFDPVPWRELAAKEFPNGLPEPFSDDPTQWLFKGIVAGSKFPLQVAVARMLGFRWPDQESDDLDALADDDGIVCLPAVGGEHPAGRRVRELLATAYGENWTPSGLDSLLVEAGGKSGDLEGWLRKVFFKNHCKVFANRPFIWQIWDGTRDGFSALINYHKLDNKLLERLTYHYLGSWWIERQRDEVRRDIPGAESRLVAAQELKQKLENILVGEPPYDVYVRWKSLAEQAIGWEPDLDDGVRMNIRPFMAAGVVRSRPNIKWNKDRGKNPDGSERLNDLHFIRTEKEFARQEEPRDGIMP